jgi:hypothetical protein
LRRPNGKSPTIERAPARRKRADGGGRGSATASAKPSQAKPNKTKQNCLDLLGFIRPNRDFSKGYEESK